MVGGHDQFGTASLVSQRDHGTPFDEGVSYDL